MSGTDIRYGTSVLSALMGVRGGDSRISLMGRPTDELDADYGLQFLELRRDGVYVTVTGQPGLTQDEFSAVTGDWELTRYTGAPLLPIPFTLAELKRVEAGALGIVEAIQAGDETPQIVERIRRNNAQAGELAALLLQGDENTMQVADAPTHGRQPFDYASLATPEELVKAFGAFTGMGLDWFDSAQLRDSPKLKAARRVKGKGGRVPEPSLFCPIEVMLWLTDRKRRKGRRLRETTAWRLLEENFPKAHSRQSSADPR